MDMTAEEAAALMDPDAPLFDILKWNDEQLASCTYGYYPDADTLYVHEEPRQPTVALPVGEYAWLRLREGGTEVVGAFVEDFVESFLPLHPEFREGWEHIVKPHLANDRQASPEEIAQYNLALIHRILDWLRESERAARMRAEAGA